MKNIKKHIKIIFVFYIAILLIIQLNVFANEEEEETDYVWLQEEIENASTNATDEPNLNSRYAVVFDRDSKTVLYSKNSDTRVPMASTTKIMTAIVLLENLAVNNNLSLDSEVEVCKQAGTIRGSRLGLKTGDKISINDLLYGLMLCSGNDAAIQIAVSIGDSVENFANLMNDKAKEMGLENTHFITPHGLDEDEHYTTAYELALMADYALNINKFSEVVSTKTYTVSINGNSKTITNTNELLGYLKGVNGVKTGFTNGAGRCLVTSVSRNGFDIITVVLGADTKKFRTKDSINLIEYTYSNYEIVNLKEMIEKEFNNWSIINKNRIDVYKGKRKTVNVKLSDIKYETYPIKKDNIKDIKIDIYNTQMELEAPIQKNTEVANLTVKVEDSKIMDVKIITSEDIERKNIKNYFFECLKSIKNIDF